MISQEEARAIIDSAIKYGIRRKATAVEVTITTSDIATSRFANNEMTQNQAPNDVLVSILVQKDGKQSRLGGDQISSAGMKTLIDNAVNSLFFLHPDKDMLPVPAPQKKAEHKTTARFDAATAKFSPLQRAAAIKEIIGVANEQGLIAAGIFSTGTTVTAIGNSENLFRYHKETSAEVSITMKHVEPENGQVSTGWAKEHGTKVGDIDVKAMAVRAAQKARGSANPVAMSPGHYTVILEPSAVLDLLGFMHYDFTATSLIDKQSCFLDKLGQKILGENITITDDAYHPLQSGAPFDGEGLQRQKVELVHNGVVVRPVTGRLSATKLGTASTCHSLAQPTGLGEWAGNMVIAGADVSLEDMIKSTKRGILLTRVWYVREVDPSTKIVTGMTRDGTFLIENGTIKCGIKNMRFNQSLLSLLNSVTALGVPVRAAGEECEPAVVPAMKVENFHFASVTTF